MTSHIVRVHASDNLTRGLYQSNVSLELQEYHSRHPNPRSDGRLDWDAEEYWLFGFNNIEQLRFWIYQDYWLNELQQEDFVVSKVYAPREFIQYGRTQAIIDSRVITRRIQIPWPTILETDND